jgi:hypothetical protein
MHMLPYHVVQPSPNSLPTTSSTQIYIPKTANMAPEISPITSIQTSSTVNIEKKGTAQDQHDMTRMGKAQQLRRNFRFVTIFGFTMNLMATWEGMLVLLPPLQVHAQVKY